MGRFPCDRAKKIRIKNGDTRSCLRAITGLEGVDPLTIDLKREWIPTHGKRVITARKHDGQAGQRFFERIIKAILVENEEMRRCVSRQGINLVTTNK